MEWVSMSAKEYRQQFGKKNKYHAQKTELNGIQFDSRKEATVYQKLQNLERSSIISNLRRQIRFELVPKQKDERPVYYVADYVFEQDGKTVIADCKSAMTKKLPAYIIKRKIFKFRYPEYEFREL